MLSEVLKYLAVDLQSSIMLRPHTALHITARFTLRNPLIHSSAQTEQLISVELLSTQSTL